MEISVGVNQRIALFLNQLPSQGHPLTGLGPLKQHLSAQFTDSGQLCGIGVLRHHYSGPDPHFLRRISYSLGMIAGRSGNHPPLTLLLCKKGYTAGSAPDLK